MLHNFAQGLILGHLIKRRILTSGQCPTSFQTQCDACLLLQCLSPLWCSRMGLDKHFIERAHGSPFVSLSPTSYFISHKIRKQEILGGLNKIYKDHVRENPFISRSIMHLLLYNQVLVHYAYQGNFSILTSFEILYNPHSIYWESSIYSPSY